MTYLIFIINILLIFQLSPCFSEERLSCCDAVPSRFTANDNSLAEPKDDYSKNPQTEGMVWIPAGEFTMGGEVADFMQKWPKQARSRNDERPLHSVKLSGFWISETPITNKQFKEFVSATGYITTAEIAPKLEEILPLLPPNTPPPSEELLVAASLVFNPPKGPVPLNNALVWWEWKAGASWQRPEGPGSSINNRLDHPVVHISYFDAEAYAKWKGMNLPTESQWEYAARGGLDSKHFVWGDIPLSEDEPNINIWQGNFPNENTLVDGFLTTSPVKYFKPNGYGLYDMSGNVWEWVADWYHISAYEQRINSNGGIVNPKGPDKSYDPQEPHLSKRVIRGGSFLCNDSYCSGYRPAARMRNSPDTSTNHTGFRIVKNID